MENRENILQELKRISEVVANLPKENTFLVPDGYFDAFADHVISMIAAENADLGKKLNPFTVPETYFDGLAGNILSRVKNLELSVEEELNELAPVLNTISKKPVYAIPDGYFESLEITVPAKVVKPSAKIFSLGKTKRFIQYAVAACTAGILMVGAYLYTNRDTSSSTNETAMAIPYDSARNMDVTEELAKVNEQDINQYLNEAPGIGYAINTSSEEEDLQQYIHAASDEEINQYLKESTEPGEKIKGT